MASVRRGLRGSCIADDRGPSKLGGAAGSSALPARGEIRRVAGSFRRFASMKRLLNQLASLKLAVILLVLAFLAGPGALARLRYRRQS